MPMSRLTRTSVLVPLIVIGLCGPSFAFAKAPPPPPKARPTKVNALDKIRGAINKIGFETATFSRDKKTFHVSYEIPSLVPDSRVVSSLVKIFSVLGVLDKTDTTFSATPSAMNRDVPFATFIVSAKNTRDYLQNKISFGGFVSTFTTKEDKSTYTKSCKASYLHSHEDPMQPGVCVCDTGYHNAENEICNEDALAPVTPPIQNPYTPPTTVVTPPAAVTPPVASGTTLKGTSTLKSSQYPGDGEGFGFDNGVTVRPHWYDFDLEYIYNDTFKNPTLSQGGNAGKGWVVSSKSFDQMTVAPTDTYCDFNITPTSESDPCNSMSASVGKNYFLRTTSGGMVKDSSGQTIALGGKIRYAKIHIVSVSPDSVTFDWVFQTKAGETGL